MLARRVLRFVAQLRFGHPAIIAALCANISLTGMYCEIRNIEHGYMLSFLVQMFFDSKRELRSPWISQGCSLYRVLVVSSKMLFFASRYLTSRPHFVAMGLCFPFWSRS